MKTNGGNAAYVYLLTLVAALGGLLFGYDTAVIADAIGHLRAHFHLTSAGEGFAAAIALAGCALGAGSAGFLSDRFGRKKVLILAALAFFVSALGTAFPKELAIFLAFRFLGGSASAPRRSPRPCTSPKSRPSASAAAWSR